MSMAALDPTKPSTPADCYAVSEERQAFDSGWVRRDLHQLVFAASGVLHLQVGDTWWLLPPQRAAWIRAGVEHRVRASEPVSLRTVHLAPSLAEIPGPPCGIFEVSGLAREMLSHATRWGIDRDPDDERANRFFLALAAMVGEWVEDPHAFCLPVARSPELARAMDYAMEHLTEDPSIEEAARLAGVSARTLARRFADEAGTSWRKFLHDARMMKAMELLADPACSVGDAAGAVGFNSLGAFTRAFVDFAGERPRDYRRRVTSEG